MRLLSALSHRRVKSTWNAANQSVLNTDFNVGFSDVLISFCTSAKDDASKIKSKSLQLPPEPQNCCMSGCANCVWIAYAEELAKILNDGGETAKQKIIEHVKDPNLRAFLMLELQHLFKKKK